MYIVQILCKAYDILLQKTVAENSMALDVVSLRVVSLLE